MNNAITFLWQEIFTDYTSFKAFTDDLGLYEETDAEAEAFNLFFYKVLAREFIDNNINFTEIDAFKMRFANVYIEYFSNFKRQKELVEASLNITNDDLRIFNETINNSANNPNTEPSNPWTPINFISNQVSSRITSNKLAAYITAIQQMPILNMDFFISKFEHLFMQYYMERTALYEN
ncbi:hypothetical protein EOM82_07010 [bacterium]|nr:hypothetical protein [bacterium]